MHSSADDHSNGLCHSGQCVLSARSVPNQSIVYTCSIPWPSLGQQTATRCPCPGPGDRQILAIPWPRGRRQSLAKEMGPMPGVRGRHLHWPRVWGHCGRGWRAGALEHRLKGTAHQVEISCEASATAQCTQHTHTAAPTLALYVHASTASSTVKGAHTTRRHRRVAAAQPCQPHTGTLTSFTLCHCTCSTF